MRPISHVTGDVGQAAVALVFKKWGWTANVCQSDYGEDLECHVFADQQRTPLYFRCQVKSSTNVAKHVRRKSSGDFGVSIAGSLCREWMLAYFPVLLVVYDDSCGIAYWVNATNEVRGRLGSLSRKSLRLTVPVENSLGNSRNAIAAELSNFYAQLFRIQSEELERTVLPLLMPRYRNPSRWDDIGRTPLVVGPLMQVEPRSLNRDNMPSWTASFRSLDARMLHGLEFRASHDKLGGFTEQMAAALEQSFANARLDPTEWLAFVCEPLRYRVEADDRNTFALRRDLTGWQSYAYIDGCLVHDHDYAFRAPDRFIRQIGRRARSWDGYFYVDVEDDIAIQLVAGVCPSPADAANSLTLREHALAQFMPWRCRTTDIEALQQLLISLELVFQPIEEVDSNENGWVSGAICTAFFEPGLGLIPQAQDWRELEHGSVQAKLRASGIETQIPGEPGDAVVIQRVADKLPNIFRNAPEQWLVMGPDARPGVPLDLSDRRIMVQRLHVTNAAEFDYSERLERLRKELADISVGTVETSLLCMEATFERIAIATAAWMPRLQDSSAESLERVSAVIIEAFDEVLPRTSTTSSIQVLRYHGELYFQGDRLY